jgi:predicted O-linked N-acetylglucosamine transferase (SPINDLY family)
MDLRPLFDQALAAHQAGRFAEAEGIYRQLLRADAGYLPALHMLGFLKAQQGRYDEAITLLNKAVRANPADVAVLSHYAGALMAAQRFDEALVAYDRLLAREPRAFDGLYNRGVILSQRAALQSQPSLFEEALASLDQAAALQPAMAAVHYNRGVVLAGLNRNREAMAAYNQALALDPSYSPARTNRTLVALTLCDWDWVAQITPEQAFETAPPLALLGIFPDKALQLRCAAGVARVLVPKALPPLWRGEIWRHDRIRLAYVSADFREHAVAFQLAPIIERHDRNRFQVIGISIGPADDSAIRQRLKKSFDRFHDFAALTNEGVAQRLKDMEIDIAIDLGGHTGLSRFQIFAHRFAPIQVEWLGYPGTTGADFMDYLIADRIVAPEEDQPFFSEKLVHLPHTYFPTDPDHAIAATPSRAEAGLPDAAFVFCCTNNSWKITRPVFTVWMRLLDQVPGSVLLLKAAPADVRANLEREAARHNIGAERLIWAGDVPLPEHLARYRAADLFLDTLPYNAHATAADALWAGLPVLTVMGEAFAGRVAASLLHAVGMPELVTNNLAEYEALALALARDPARLASLKEKLARNIGTTPLFDADRFTRDLEAAYLKMTPS